MPKRVARHRIRERYVSKEYREYEAAWNRMHMIESMAADLYGMAARPGFMARLLGKPQTVKPVKTREQLMADVPELRPYRRHERYHIPKSWPRPFVFTPPR